MLVFALSEHEGALRASLQSEYGIRLSSHGLSLFELTDLVGNLPPGCALWRAIGGPEAWSPEMHMLNLVDYRLEVLVWFKTKDGQKGRNRPKLRTPPPLAHERAVVEARESSRGRRWLDRQARISEQ